MAAMKAGHKPATKCPNYERQYDSEYEGERPVQARLNTYRRRQDGKCRVDWVTECNRHTEAGPDEVRREEREDRRDIKSPQHPACQKGSGGDPFVSPNFLEEAYRNGFQHLTPVPHPVLFLLVLFGKVAEDRIIVRPGAKMFQHPRCSPRRLFRRHAFSPFSSGRPFHKFIRDRRASRASRIPASVIRK